MGYCLSFAISIALSQIFIIAFAVFILLNLVKESKSNLGSFLDDFNVLDGQDAYVSMLFYRPALLWLGVSLISCFWGLGIASSLREFLKFSLYFLLPILILYSFKNSKLDVRSLVYQHLKLMFFGQVLAALHTVFCALIGKEIQLGIPGPLTEAGQISLLFPIYLAFLYNYSKTRKFSDKEFLKVMVVGIFLFLALLINLKRGPWIAVFATAILFYAFVSLRRVLIVVAIAIMISLYPPIWQRIADFKDHFYISGGRFDMWKLGFQLIERFPLGIGHSNSDLMRKFDPTLPLLHRHMHNNILNITLESGILGGLLYVWWFYSIVKNYFIILRSKFNLENIVGENGFPKLLIYCFLLSILVLQIAGLVEYNFGDGEIRYLFLVLMGFLISLLANELRKLES